MKRGVQCLTRYLKVCSPAAAFLLALVVVQICAHMGSFNFTTVFPWLFFLTLLIGYVEVKEKRMGRAQGMSWKKKAYVLPVLGVAVIELLLEDVLKCTGIVAVMGVMIIVILMWLIFGQLCSASVDISLGGGALLFAFFSATVNKTIFDERGWAGWILALVGWTVLFYPVLLGYRKMLDRIMPYGTKRTGAKILRWGGFSFVLSVGIDFLFFLTYYPGVMEYDSFVQMCQVLGDPYSNHHPWLHTMLIKIIYDFGVNVLRSANRAFALYSLFSICMLSFAFSCVVAYLSMRGLRAQYLLLVILAYVLSPIDQMYSIIMWKDIPFGVSVILFTVLLCVMIERQWEGKISRLLWLLFVPVGFCVCFFRSNGLYVFLGMIPFLIWTFWRQKKYVISAIAAVLLLGIFYKGPVFHYYNVKEPDLIESLSVPAQQIAAVIAYDGNISEEQKKMLSEVIDLAKVPEAYLGSRGCSDAIKDLVREKDNQEYIAEHSAGFFKLWLSLFWENRRIYVDAYIEETKGYWYHQVHFPFIWATYIHENGMGIERESKVPEAVADGISCYLKGYKGHFDRYLSVGLYIYFCLGCFFVALSKRSRYLLCYLPVIGIWMTLLIATPVNADLRYAYAIYISAPLLFCVTLNGGEGTERVCDCAPSGKRETAVGCDE